MMRDAGTGHLPIFSQKFHFKGESFIAEIRPALLNEEDQDGNAKSMAYYPSGREELVEDALRKIASRKANGFVQNAPEMTSGVSFTLYELQCELARLGHTLSHKEITQALNIMRFSSIDIYLENGDKKARVSSSYIPVLMSVSKRQYDSDPDSKWVVHFHPFVTQGIMAVAYRQFNYELMMSLSTQLGRWLHKYLCMKFTGAGLASPPFEIHFNTIKRDSGLLKAKQERNNYISVIEALDELKFKGILSDWRKKEIIGPRGKYLDIIYYLTPSMEFIKEVKAANRRVSDSKEILNKATVDRRLSR